MLARNFLTPDDLGILDQDYEALVKVLGMLERKELPWHQTWPVDIQGFNMASWPIKCRSSHHCGTIGCIGYWCERMGADPGLDRRSDNGLYKLFFPNHSIGIDADPIDLSTIRPEQAAEAIRNYLSTGAPNWVDVLA